MSIRSKLTIIFLALTLIPALLVSALSFTNYKNSLETARMSQLQDLATFKQERIEAYFSGLKSDIEIARGLYNIKRHLPVLSVLSQEQFDPQFVAARKILDRQLRHIQRTLGLSDILLFNARGRAVYSSDPKHSFRRYLKISSDAEKKVFEEGERRVYFSDVFPNQEENNKPGIMIAAPVSDFHGVFIGVIVFKVDMAPIYALIQDATGLGQTGETLIGKREGNEAVFLNPLRHEEGVPVRRSVLLGGKTGIPIQRAVLGGKGIGRLTDYRGHEVIAAWRHIPSLDWGMVAKIDVDEAFADVTNLKILVRLILVFVLVLAGLIALYIAKSISGPINKLSRDAEIVGQGNLDHKVGIDQGDEIGQLSKAFDKMTADLKKVTASRDDLNREIAERSQAQEALRQSEEHLREVSQRLTYHVDNSPLAVIEWGPDMRLIRWSGTAEQMFGWKAEEVLGKRMEDFRWIYHDDETKVSEVSSQLQEGIRPRQLSANRNYRKDGSVIFCEWYNSSLLDDSGKLRSILSLVLDVTARRQAEEVLKRDKEMLESLVKENAQELVATQVELERAKRLSDIGTLAATVAHELRNPLAAIHMAAYNLYHKSGNPALEKHLHVIQKKIDESDQIINNLLFYSRIRPPQNQEVRLDEILEESITVACSCHANQKVSLIRDYEQAGKMAFHADPLQLKEVFTNIANNAFDAMIGKDGHVTFRARVEDPFVCVQVKDEGTGIGEDVLEKIFDPFFTTKARGTGLGLTVCRQIVTAHGGMINIASQKDIGTTVTVSLPLRQEAHV